MKSEINKENLKLGQARGYVGFPDWVCLVVECVVMWTTLGLGW